MRTIYTLVDRVTKADAKDCQHEHRSPGAARRCNRAIQAACRSRHGGMTSVRIKPMAADILPHSNTRLFRKLNTKEERAYFGF